MFHTLTQEKYIMLMTFHANQKIASGLFEAGEVIEIRNECPFNPGKTVNVRVSNAEYKTLAEAVNDWYLFNSWGRKTPDKSFHTNINA